eukprot:CAMPEP_0171452094 /NCGR_PEP_ID=MMETSP0945-20130129/333_1 /TAXON_ID=109269 /ORGANISM="Vaucheria litorea, Strain CCMP2940" /LENGTH=351 /DNA_ID=CAMNT_0011976679 /DNA_START=399 /DNA_END=1454 /DNA_ORIENTATION=-
MYMEEQLLVKELMDTTPSSSFEAEGWRDGYVYDQDSNALGIHPIDREYSESDDDEQDGIVHGNVPVKQCSDSDLFEKIEVKKLSADEINDRPSLLSGAIAALLKPSEPILRFGNHFMENKISKRAGTKQSKKTLLTGDEDCEEDDMADTGGCSARQLISAVLKQCQIEYVSPLLFDRPPEAYDLRISDMGQPDLDFPELDSSAAIIDVGVDEFVLCEAGCNSPLLVIEVVVEGGGKEKGKASGSLVLQVTFYEPIEPDKRKTMLLPIELLPDPVWFGNSSTFTKTRRRSTSRTSGLSVEGSSVDPSALTRIRNIDTGEEINVCDYDSKVPKCISPRKLFGEGGNKGCMGYL